MLRYVKDGEQRTGEVVGSAGFALIVQTGPGREVVHKFQAEDPAEFQRTWDQISPLAGALWQTDEGPVPLE